MSSVGATTPVAVADSSVDSTNLCEDDWKVSCSDDEKYCPTNGSIVNGQFKWEPKPEDIIHLYMTLEKKGVLDLEWQCPGRRSPSVHSSESGTLDRKPLESGDARKNRLEPNEFDFDDDLNQNMTPKITPRRRGTTAGSASQKRVARLDKVMSDIRRHQKLDKLKNRTPVGDTSFEENAAPKPDNA